MQRNGVVYYLHGDHLGSTSLTTYGSGPQAGEVVARQLYHLYGEVRWSDGTLPTDFTFTGQKAVPGTGLVFMHARYYHRLIYGENGRRLFEDWMHAASILPLTKYRYRLPHKRRVQKSPSKWMQRWPAKPENTELLQHVLEQIRREGLLRASNCVRRIH